MVPKPKPGVFTFVLQPIPGAEASEPPGSQAEATTAQLPPSTQPVQYQFVTLNARKAPGRGRKPRKAAEGVEESVGGGTDSAWAQGGSQLLETTDNHSPAADILAADRLIKSTLQTLRVQARIGPFNIVCRILEDDTPLYSSYRKKFYGPDNDTLDHLLTTIANCRQGRVKLSAWLKSSGRSLITNIVGEEMDEVTKAEIMPGLATITPQYVKTWTLESHKAHAPFTIAILTAAAQTERAARENKLKKPDEVCRVIVKQLAYQRSGRALRLQAQYGLYLWSSGASRQAIDSAHRCVLSICYTSVHKLMKKLGEHAMKDAIWVAKSPHLLGYDNINLSTSIFVEQRGAATPEKVSSGTFAILYPIPNANPEDMKIEPVMDCFLALGPAPLNFEHDIRPSPSLAQIVNSNLVARIIQILIKHNKALSSYATIPSLQPIIRRLTAQEPRGTEQFPTEVSAHEEASVEGNILFQDELYWVKLQCELEDLEGLIPLAADQLTNLRNRTIKEYRAQDITPWERRDNFQPTMGIFHLELNFSWTVNHVHRGSL
ncbi:hypothetical protein EST38_g3984, partial [Candolleomyces aberdarensis]